MSRYLILVVAAAACLRPAAAVSPLWWRLSEFSDFENAERHNVALRSDGQISLAQVFEKLLDSSSPYLWALVEDSKGNLYSGGGGAGSTGARIYILPPEGGSRVLAEFDALGVHALAVDRDGRLYAATSPEARVYRITPGGKPELFYDASAKYAWAMVFDSQGNLYLATGDPGLVHRITPEGKGSVFFKTGETHARSLLIDASGNLIIGTEPEGLVIRVTPKGEGFVLYQTPKREVTALAAGANGIIYAAAAGNKQPAAAPPPPAPAPAPATQTQGAAAGAAAAQTAAQPAATALPQQPSPITGGSEVYRIEPGGYARRLWNHAQEIAYALALDSQGRLLVGTGNKGHIYRIESETLSSVVATASSTQVTSLLAGRNGRIYAATGNIGQLYRLGPELVKEGSLESEVLDAGLFSHWGRLIFRGTPNGGQLRFETRSGNLSRPREGWSQWSALAEDAEGGRVLSPAARFLQWRLVMRAAPSGASPELYGVSVAYLPNNAAPVIQQIEITPANYRFPAQSLTITPSRTLTLQPLGRQRRSSPVPMADSGVVTLQYEKGQIGARWAASDENGDELLFKVEIRGAGETQWRLLKDKVKEKYLSWDSTVFPDGEYRLRITATDLPDNPPGQELTAQMVSAPFLIDNSPPQITGLRVTRTGSGWEVRWSAADAYSLIQRAEYSIDGGDWLLVEPLGRISDSRNHAYLLRLENLAPGSHIVAVRVTDDYDNETVARAVLE